MPQRIQAVGRHSCVVAELFRGSLRDMDAAAAPAALQEYTMAKWVIFDRGADLLTPLLSQLTIEGRLDELQNTAPKTGWLAAERDAGVCPLPFPSCPLPQHTSSHVHPPLSC